ncbi:4042_t:CDS:2 [Ambispora leptoticha]|uniref:4042_t:CDS:1 n=1 Tax=Ambispora leptoticha TaxID=144679 RepID=A0A9N9B9J9_9GLOM|nr:4042_t:CDS:2 [Ambispora leptoticha]
MNSSNKNISMLILFTLLIFGVVLNTTTFALAIKEKRGSITCESLFKTNECSVCQQTVHNIKHHSDSSLKDCFALYDVNTERAYRLLISDLDSTCQSECDTQIIQDLNTKIQTDCKDELTQFVENLMNPDNDTAPSTDVTEVGTDDNDDSPIYEVAADITESAGNLWMLIYSIIPLHQSLCAKNSTGGYYVIEVETDAADYVFQLSDGQFTKAIVNFVPPDAQVIYGPFTGDQIYTTLPKELLCSDPYQNISKPWIDYTKSNNTLFVDALQTYVSDIMAPIIGNSTNLCVNSNDVVENN